MSGAVIQLRPQLPPLSSHGSCVACGGSATRVTRETLREVFGAYTDDQRGGFVCDRCGLPEHQWTASGWGACDCEPAELRRIANELQRLERKLEVLANVTANGHGGGW